MSREPYVDRDELNQIARNHQVEIRMLYADNERLRAAAEDALATLEAIELLDASRLGMKAEIVTASCDKLHRALEPKP